MGSQTAVEEAAEGQGLAARRQWKVMERQCRGIGSQWKAAGGQGTRVKRLSPTVAAPPRSSSHATRARLQCIRAGWCQRDAIENGYSTRAKEARTPRGPACSAFSTQFGSGGVSAMLLRMVTPLAAVHFGENARMICPERQTQQRKHTSARRHRLQ